jgi:hypothetical protein
MSRDATGFGDLPAAKLAEFRAAAGRIKATIKRCVRDIGRELTVAKEGLTHGQFGYWLGHEVEMEPRTAQHYLSGYRLIEKNENFAHLGRAALYQLAAPSVADGVIETVDRLISEGNPPSFAAVKNIIAVDKGKAAGPAVNPETTQPAYLHVVSPKYQPQVVEFVIEREPNEPQVVEFGDIMRSGLTKALDHLQRIRREYSYISALAPVWQAADDVREAAREGQKSAVDGGADAAG